MGDEQWHEGGSQWHEQGNLGNQQWQHQDEDANKVPCAGEHCTCEWASAKQCSEIDAPRTECWSCCCRTKFPDSFRFAMSHQDQDLRAANRPDLWQPGQGPSYGHGHEWP